MRRGDVDKALSERKFWWAAIDEDGLIAVDASRNLLLRGYPWAKIVPVQIQRYESKKP